MYLVQVLLPLYDNAAEPLPASLQLAVRDELAERFGGLTAYTRAPAEGLWKEGNVQTHRDDIVVYEVMSPSVDDAWWSSYRRQLESRFRQQQVVVRVQEIRLL